MLGASPATHSSTTQGGSTTDKRILPAFLLFFFFGGLGAHRFYVGRAGGALIYIVAIILFLVGLANPLIEEISDDRCGGLLIVVAVLLLGITGLIDFIQIITGNFCDAQGYRITQWT
jgi:hypothetical protein